MKNTEIPYPTQVPLRCIAKMISAFNRGICWLASTCQGYIKAGIVKPTPVQEKYADSNDEWVSEENDKPNSEWVSEEGPKIYYCQNCDNYIRNDIEKHQKHPCKQKPMIHR
jgi:hypothetical protein